MMSAIVDSKEKATTNGNELVIITNPDVEITLPQLQYGYRSTKATWEELVQIIRVDNDIPKLSRSRAQQHHYEIFRYHMREQYRSVVDYILISKFGFRPVVVVAASGDGDDDAIISSKWVAEPRIGDVQSPQKVLVENDFPYCVEDNIVHYVLWKLKEPISPKEILDAKNELLSEKIKAVEILHWVNPPNLQSVSEIDHVHFLCRL